MAGRGKGMTLPAWMTGNGQDEVPPPGPSLKPESSTGSFRSRSRSSSARRGGRRNRSRSRSRSRDRDSHRDRSRDGSRLPHGERRGKKDRDRSESPNEPPKKWVSRVKNKKSNFDVRPPDGVVLPPIGGLGTSLNPALPVGVDGCLQSGLTSDAANMQQTKHARRIYIGGISNTTTEKDIETFIRDTIYKAMAPNKPAGGDPVISTYVNRDKCFCFMELSSIELTTACCSLDGISYCNNTLKIRRPNDFRPEAMPSDVPPAPVFNLAALGIVGTTVAEGPGKVFIGGLPYHLTEDEIKELLSAFGPLRSFHLVKDAGAVNSKGYAFCEYLDMANTHMACQGLNDLRIGDKTLTVRVSAQSQAPPPPPAASFAFNANNGGIGVQNPFLQQPHSTASSSQSQIATKVIVLKNMVTAEELRDDDEFLEICEDVKEECSQHGAVNSVLIPRAKENYPVHCEGSVYVEFHDTESAQKAAFALSGRKFADRTVNVDFYDEIKFSNKILL